MPNSLNLYDPLFYANEALIILRNKMGMANRVHRGYDRTAQTKGSVINISAPASFTAQDAPSTAQDLTPGNVSITLDNWREVKFALTDKELTLARDQIVSDHIAPAAIAIANDLDTKLASLYKRVGYAFTIAGGTMALADIASGRKVMFNNKAPVSDAMNLHLMIDGNSEAALLPIIAPYTMGGATAADTLRNGSLGKLMGYDVFANQNTPSHTSATITDTAGTITGAHAKGVTSLSIAGIDTTANVKEGDIITIAGDPQGYAVTADRTASGGAITDLPISPALKIALSGSEVVTLNITSGATKVQNLMFHRNAFALATAPLSTMASDLGARIETVTDPVTGISLRSRVFYEGDASKVYVALDVLYGYAILDSNLAVRIRS